MREFGLWLLAMVTLFLIAFFIYPTPYVYVVDKPFVFRTSRITGKSEVSSADGWKPLITPVIAAQPKASPVPKPASAPR